VFAVKLHADVLRRCGVFLGISALHMKLGKH
jgi:hypothetical protein